MCQQMRGKTTEEIIAERHACMKAVSEEFKQEVVDANWFPRYKNPVSALGQSLKAMPRADVIVFIGEAGLNQDYSGCYVEWLAYGRYASALPMAYRWGYGNVDGLSLVLDSNA
jgi:hypothetical protein